MDAQCARTYYGSMNVTLKMTQADEAESAVAQLEALWAEEDYRSADPWTREELHERSTLRRPFES